MTKVPAKKPMPADAATLADVSAPEIPRADDALETVKPIVDFEGYPFGEPVQFRAKVESQPIPSTYAQLLRDKGLVADK